MDELPSGCDCGNCDVTEQRGPDDPAQRISDEPLSTRGMRTVRIAASFGGPCWPKPRYHRKRVTVGGVTYRQSLVGWWLVSLYVERPIRKGSR